MSNRFHSKYHRTNHHTYGSDINFGTPTNPDSGHDPIASPDHPFKGDFVLRGGLSASVPSQSAYAAAFAGNLLLTGSLIVEDDVFHMDFDDKIVGININPVNPINYRTNGDFDFVVNKNASFLRNITTPTLSANYVRIDISDNAFNYPLEILDKENLKSYFLVDNQGRVGVNMQFNRNLDNYRMHVKGRSLFQVDGEEFKIRGNTLINQDVAGYSTKIQTNASSGPIKMGPMEFVTVSANTMRVDGEVVLSKNFYVSGNSEFGENFTDTIITNARVASNFVPHIANNVDLGLTILPWKTLYFQTLSGGTGTFEGNIQVSGNSIFGSATNDTISTIARINTNFVPHLANNVDLGLTSLPWKTLYFQTLSGGAGTFKGSLLVNENVTIDGNTTLGSDANDIVTVNARIETNIVPRVANSIDLGLTSIPWRTLYFQSLSGGSGIFKGNLNINTNLTVDGKTVLQDTDTKSLKILNSGTSLIALDVDQTGGNTDVANFKSGGSSALIIKDSGNVGINTIFPNQKLTINGNLSTNGFLYFENGNYLFGDNVGVIESSNDFKVNANTSLGSNANTHTVNFGNSKINSNFLPKNNTVTIGSTTERWNEIYATTLNANNGLFSNYITVQTDIDENESDSKKVLNKSSADVIYKNFEDSILNISPNGELINSTVNQVVPNFLLNYNISQSSQSGRYFESTFIYHLSAGSATGVTTRFVINTNNLAGILMDTFKIITEYSSGNGNAISSNIISSGYGSAGNLGELVVFNLNNTTGYIKRTVIFKTNPASTQTFQIIPGFSSTGGQFMVMNSSFATKRKMT